MMRSLLPLCSLVTMNAAASDGASRGGSVTKMQKNFLSAVPRRGPEVGILRIEGDFHGWV